MEAGLLRYYNQELQHLRELGAEFAREFPKIASRLGMDGIEVTDPYVERLLEGAAFLAGRVQLRLDAEFPRFTQRLLEIVYPNYLAPTPSMLVARFAPDLTDTNLAAGFMVPRGSAIRSVSANSDITACEFRTAHDVELWPIELVAAEYFAFAPDLPLTSLPFARQIRGGVRLRLRTAPGLLFSQLKLDRLRLFLSGNEEVACKLQELCVGSCLGALVAPGKRPWPWWETLPRASVSEAGFDDDEALLPVSLRSFQGYRLLQEYFAFPQRFLFVDVSGLEPALRRHDGNEIEVVLLFGRTENGLEGVVDKSSFSLFCSPAINLFQKRADRIHLNDGSYDYHVVADRMRPMDFEIHSIAEVKGYGVGADSEQQFHALYSAYHQEDEDHTAYFTVHREPRLLSEGQRKTGFRSSYAGTEVYLSLVDPDEAPYRSDLRQLALTTNCTNRDLPLLMQLGIRNTDFTLETAAPVQGIHCVKGPSRPSAPLAQGSLAWRFLNHLSIGYLSLLNTTEREGAAVLRNVLELYASSADAAVKKQIEGVQSVRVKKSVRRLPGGGPIAFGRGLCIELVLDEMAFQGGSAFLFGCVMEKFMQRYVTINAFTETVVRSLGRGEIFRGMPRCGERPIL